MSRRAKMLVVLDALLADTMQPKGTKPAIRMVRDTVESMLTRQTEWLCEACSTVFPRPSGKGPLGMLCECRSGFLKPTTQAERMLEQKLREHSAAVEELVHAARAARFVLSIVNEREPGTNESGAIAGLDAALANFGPAS